MLNSAFDGVGAKPGDYYPAALRGEIDAINARIYDTVNNGVYKAGFATTQAAYEEAVVPLFDTLDWARPAASRTWRCVRTRSGVWPNPLLLAARPTKPLEPGLMPQPLMLAAKSGGATVLS